MVRCAHEGSGGCVVVWLCGCVVGWLWLWWWVVVVRGGGGDGALVREGYMAAVGCGGLW